MSLDYVHKGEAVKASTINSIINTIGGNQRMSPDLNVTTTARGPQVSMPSNYGGPNQKPDHILDVGRYMLSSWPMVKLELGFTLNDCLGAIRYHRADGTTSTPVSAAVVYQNSEDCPTGSDISGYALDEDAFGKDAAAYAAGWVDTFIEDPYPTGVLKAQLWKYKSGTELAEVFTNVDDQLSVQQQLSTVLQANGASGEELSSLKMVCSWKLLDSTTLSAEGQENLVPTHELVRKHGIIDCYEIGGFDYNVVLKASLECIDVQKDGSGEVQSTTWAWKIPLGPDADCSEGKAHSSSVTYGGNEVLFEVEEGEIGPGFSGDATYNDKAIWYGCYETQAGEEVDADEVWLNLSYAYEDKAVKGAFASTKDSGSYTQDGILGRNVFVVKLSSFKPGADVAKGDKAPAESLEHGTWGVLPKDGPKLDTYCKKDSTTEFKSLDWADREGEEVECQCAQLYQFDQLETVDPLSTDHIVIRRPDDDDGAELKYISLSALQISGMYVPPDADVEDAETSSLQTRQLDNGSTVEEMFNFHLSDTVDVHISDLTGVDIVIRNPNDGQPYVQYGKLCIDIAPDAQGQTEQKSLDWLSSTNELQLYKFDKDGLSNAFEPDVTVNGTREYLLPNDYEFVLRKHGAGGEVTYGQVALSVKMEELSGDSQVSEQKSININNSVIELYRMGEAGKQMSAEVPTSFDEPESILSDDCEFVIRKGGAGGEIDYTTVKLRQAVLSVDRQGHPNQRSLQYANLGDGTFLELNEFHADGTTKPKVTLTSADTSLLPADNEFLIRRKVNGYWQLEYAPLSAKVDLSAIPVDTDHTQSQKSIEWAEDANGKYLQLYKMDEEGQDPSLITLKRNGVGYSLLPDDYEFVVRSRQGGQIDYMPVELCSMLSGGGGSPNVDTDGTSTRSIQYNDDDELELYKFDDSSFMSRSLVDFSLSTTESEYYSQKGYRPENSAVDDVGCSQFLTRTIGQIDGKPQVEYHLLDVKLPQFIGPDGNDYGAHNLGQKSIELHSYGAADASELYWQLYNFDELYASNERAYDTTAELSGSTLVNWLAGCYGVRVKAFQNGSEEVQWLEKQTTNGCGRNSLTYSHMYIVPPAFIRSDDDASTASDNNKTLEVVKDGCVDNCYWRLYHWGCDNGTLTVDLDDNTQATELNSRKVLMMSDDGTTLEYHPLHFTYDGSQYALTSDITVIDQDLREIWDDIDALSGWCAELSAELSGQYWEQGGDSTTNYGSDIGNSGGCAIIDLDGQQLVGCWKTSDFTVDYTLNVGCTANVGTLVASDVIGCTGTFGPLNASSFTLGSTSLSETQLQQLLALI